MRTLFVLILLAGLGYGGWWWWQQQQGPPQPKILQTVTLERAAIREVLEATGIVKSQVGAVVKIGVQATGLITSLPFRVGDPVDKGELIARIDDRELLAQKQQLEAEIQRDQAEVTFARRFVNRQRGLLSSRAVDANTVEDAERQLAVAEATLAQAVAELETLKVRLSYTRIYSPITGVVGNVTAQEGETVVAGLQVANLITVVDPSRLEMWIYMDETDIGRVQPGQAVEFTVDAYPDETFQTIVEQIYPLPEIRDNIVYYQVLCKISVKQSQKLRPEMTTQCQVVVQEKPDVLALPNNALKWVDGRNVVFVAPDVPSAPQPDASAGNASGPASAPPVRRLEEGEDFTLGLRGLTHSEALTGFEAGDKVATQVVVPQGGKTSAKGRGRGD